MIESFCEICLLFLIFSSISPDQDAVAHTPQVISVAEHSAFHSISSKNIFKCYPILTP